MDKLAHAVIKLEIWKRTRKTKGYCLGSVRWALGQVGLQLPWRPWPWANARANFDLMVKNPEKYGWQQLHSPLNSKAYYLAYFKTGKYGHVGILHNNIIFADVDYSFTQSWADKIIGVFIPL